MYRAIFANRRYMGDVTLSDSLKRYNNDFSCVQVAFYNGKSKYKGTFAIPELVKNVCLYFVTFSRMYNISITSDGRYFVGNILRMHSEPQESKTIH